MATEGIQGLLTSVTSSTDLNVLLMSATAPYSMQINQTGEEQDVTAFASGLASMSYTPGLRSWDATVQARFPRSTPKIGNTGLVTLSSGYALWVQSWTLTINAAVRDITQFASSGPTWRTFRPGIIDWSASFEALVDRSTGVGNPAAAAAAAVTGTFKLTEEGATDNSLSGSGFVTQVGSTVTVGDVNKARFNFRGTGNLSNTYATGMGLLSSGSSPYAIVTPTWDTNGDDTPDVSVVMTAASGRTYTGNAFWRSITLTCEMGSPIDVSVQLQGSGALTVA